MISVAAVERALQRVASVRTESKAAEEVLDRCVAMLVKAIRVEMQSEPKRTALEVDGDVAALSVAVITLCDHLKCWRWTFSREECEQSASESGRRVQVVRSGETLVLRVEPK